MSIERQSGGRPYRLCGSVALSVCLLSLCHGGEPTPYERLQSQVSVWSQSIDTGRIDTTRLVESREKLGVFPVGNGRCFTYLGLGFPQNTLFMMTGLAIRPLGTTIPSAGSASSP